MGKKHGSPESTLRGVLPALFAILLFASVHPAAQASAAVHPLAPGVHFLFQEQLLSGEQTQEPVTSEGPIEGQDPATQQNQEPPPQEPEQELEPTTPANDPFAGMLATVHGQVRNAATGEPLPRTLVQIEGDAGAAMLTDGDGRFEFPAVPVGPQTFRLLRPGFHDRPYATEDISYQADGPAHSVLVSTQMPELIFALTPTCAIHGNVDLSTGDPGQGITVTLVKRVVRNGRAVWAQSGTTKTNGEGAYRFAGLPAGVYVIYTQPALESEPAVTAVAAGSAANVTRSGFPGVFYPDAREFSGASRIRLSAGEQAQADLTLNLEPFHTVTASAFLPNGRLFVPNSPSETGFNATLQYAIVMDASGHRLSYLAQYDNETRTIQVNLPDGIYSLLISVGTDELSQSAGKSPIHKQVNLAGFVEFSVAGQAVTNLRIPLALTPSWLIRLKAERTALRMTQSTAAPGQGLQSQITVSATDAGETPVEGAGGSVSAEDAGPDMLDLKSAGFGSNWIGTMAIDRNLCVGSFTAGGVNLAREPLSLSLSAAPPPMELILRDDCASLALQLPSSLSAFLPGEEPFYTVYVVPDFDTTTDIPPMTVHPSSGATLTLEGLTPGNYHVYIFDRPVRLEYRNPAVLAALPSQGQPVTLTPGATSELILEVPER